MTKDHVLEIFGNFGKVVYCDVPMDKQKSWINTSLAYVEYEKLEEADECIKKMDGGMLKTHVWLVGCPNPNKMEQSWECIILNVFSHIKKIKV